MSERSVQTPYGVKQADYSEAYWQAALCDRIVLDVALEARGRQALALGLGLAIGERGVISWRDADGRRLELSDSKVVEYDKGWRSLPTPLVGTALVEMVFTWLSTTAVYGPQPDIDGSVSKGFKVVHNAHSCTAPDCVVEPSWIEYHK